MNLAEPDLILAATTGILGLIRLSRGIVFSSIAAINHKDGNVHYEGTLPSVSIVITAHDQAEELSRNLPMIFSQDYPGEVEIIVVNDASTDDTEDVLKRMKDEHSNFYYTFTPKSARYVSHKKLAITLGVKAAHHDWIILTDPNCHPMTDQWLRSLTRVCNENTEIVVGPSLYEQEEGTHNLNRINFYRILAQMKQYARSRRGALAYRSSSVNMMFRKELFIKNKGFSKNLNLKRGEDTLFVNETATNDNTLLATSQDAVVAQEMPIVQKIWNTDRLFYIETQRHLTMCARLADKYYQVFYDTVLIAFIALLIAGIAICAINKDWIVLPTFPVITAIVWGVNGLLFDKSAKYLGCTTRYSYLLPFYELEYIIDELKFGIRYLFRSKTEYYRS